jgi:transcriptional regulator
MYLPKRYQFEDNDEVIAFMKQYNFAAIITAKDGSPVANHLPFVICRQGDDLILESHFAKSNKQWEQIVENEVLVIFTEPHAYISPKHYDSALNVPTWNYLAVHAYGKGLLIEKAGEVAEAMDRFINAIDPEYKKQWEQLPDDFKKANMNGIVAFTIHVTDLQAKKKLSQNRKPQEQQRIITHLSASSSTAEKSVAEFMQSKLHSRS